VIQNQNNDEAAAKKCDQSDKDDNNKTFKINQTGLFYAAPLQLFWILK